MNHRLLSAFLGAALLATGSISQAHPHGYSSHRPVQGLFVAGFTAGGEDLVTVRYGYGGSEDIEAGGELLVGGGVLIHPRYSPWQYQFTLNYHTDGAYARDGDTDFSRFPLEGLMFYRLGYHRLGFGLSLHLDPELKIDIDGTPRQRVPFDNALGLVLEYDYSLTPSFILGLRYTDISYQTARSPRVRVDGNHGGLMFYVRF